MSEIKTLKKKSISIKPLLDATKPNMGLEKNGQVLFESVYHTEQLCCLEENGRQRYITGLNEFDPAIKNIKDPELKKAKIKEIRKIVALLEKELASNYIDEKLIDGETAEFWNKVELLKPNNVELWGKIELSLSGNGIELDIENKSQDLIIFHAIKAGGFNMVASSYDEALKMNVSPKFYLDIENETIEINNTSKKLKNKALSMLNEVFEKEPKKLFFVVKEIDMNFQKYYYSTNKEYIYDVLDNYINGKLFEKDNKKASQRFINIVEKPFAELKLTAMIHDNIYGKEIIQKREGYYWKHGEALLGNNITEILEFVKNELNSDVREKMRSFSEERWNK